MAWPPHTRWRGPLLAGELADWARATAVGIGRALCGGERVPPADPSLAGGHAGIAVTLAELERAFPEEGFGAAAVAAFERAADALASAEAAPGLLGGVTGVAAAGQLLRALGTFGPGEDPCEDMDGLLLDALRVRPFPHELDLGSGAAGIGAYALLRGHRPLVEAVVELLEASAEPQPVGIAFRSGPSLIAAIWREKYPRGVLNLGLAHGVPGQVAFLAGAVRAGVERARPLLEASVAWLRSQRREGAAPSAYGYWEGEPGVRGGARAGWCYGDPGVAMALFRAGWALGREDVWRSAEALARETARRAPSDTGIRDACLCHGAAGLSHQLGRAWHFTGDGAVREGAVAWAGRLRALHRPGEGSAFRAWTGGDDFLRAIAEGEGQLTDDWGMLFGAAGVALALAAATSEQEPAWDAALLLSPP